MCGRIRLLLRYLVIAYIPLRIVSAFWWLIRVDVRTIGSYVTMCCAVFADYLATTVGFNMAHCIGRGFCLATRSLWKSFSLMYCYRQVISFDTLPISQCLA